MARMPNSINYSLKMAHNTSGLQRWLENIWYNDSPAKYLLLPLSALYCGVNAWQRWWQSRSQHHSQPRFPCAVIVVGNITVGGTGKTPLTIYLTEILQEAGYRPAIITRGYGGKAIQQLQAVTPRSDPAEVGDEAVLIASTTGVPVYAGANRLESINTCLKNHNCNIIISDDGMQHYKMPRDIQIAVIDGERQLGNRLCLPAGPLREPARRLKQCHFIVVNGNEKKQNLPGAFKMTIQGNELINLKTAEKRKLDDFQGKTVHVVSGIGNPQRFYNSLQRKGLKLIKHSFPDHYQFKPDDLQFKPKAAIIMTQKDAVKCHPFAPENSWYLPIKARLDNDFATQLIKLLGACLRTGIETKISELL